MDDVGRGGFPHWQDLDDPALLALLGDALRSREEPPEAVVRLAKASFGLHDLDAELARLVADSLDEATRPRVRSAAAPRMLTFETAAVTLEVEVLATATGWRLVGQVSPPGTVDRVRLRRPDRPDDITTPTDDHGRFVVDTRSPGPAGLVCRRPGDRPVVTSWFLLG